MTQYKLPVLDSENKVPTVKLGGSGADNTKFLRGDQTWHIPVDPQSSVSVYRETSTKIISALTYTKVDWNAIDWDIYNEFSLTTDRYTAITPGKRLITCSVLLTSVGNDRIFKLAIYKNAIILKVNQYWTSGTGGRSINISAIIDMNVNDYIEIYVYNGVSSDKTIEGNASSTFLNIQKLL